MNTAVRRNVLSCDIDLGCDDKGMAAQVKLENLACQLQEMFCALEHSTRRSYSPRGMRRTTVICGIRD